MLNGTVSSKNRTSAYSLQISEIFMRHINVINRAQIVLNTQNNYVSNMNRFEQLTTMRVADMPNFSQINPSIIMSPLYSSKNKNELLTVTLVVGTTVTSIKYDPTSITAYFSLISSLGAVIYLTNFVIANTLKPY